MRLLNLQHWAVKAPRGGAWVRRLGWGKGQSRLPGIPVSSCFVSICSPRLFRVNDPEDLEAPEGSRECPWTVTCLCPKQGVGAVGRRIGKAEGLHCALECLQDFATGRRRSAGCPELHSVYIGPLGP